VYGKSLANIKNDGAERLNWINDGTEWSGTVRLGAEALRYVDPPTGATSSSILPSWCEWYKGWEPRENGGYWSNGLFRGEDAGNDVDLEVQKIKGKWIVSTKRTFHEVILSELQAK